ncbi:hypothetical protein CR513_37238, partial [Mucuna pruriens]
MAFISLSLNSSSAMTFTNVSLTPCENVTGTMNYIPRPRMCRSLDHTNYGCSHLGSRPLETNDCLLI